jgi:hypothetical protein
MKKIVDGIAVDMSPEEIAEFETQQAEWAAGADDRKAEEIRKERNTKLAESDWTQVSDAPVDQAAWATYRQALRDITEHANFPNIADEDWPVAP